MEGVNVRIPFFDIKRQYEGIATEVESEVLSIMKSAIYIGGNKVSELESKLADYIGVKHAISCGNGTDALVIALKAIGVKSGDEVITTPFSFFATAEAISNVGAIPVFADICEDTLNINPESIRNKITNRTAAILPVHIFGLPAEMDEINAIATEYGISVIEDACQAIGAEYKGKKTGGLGTLGCFSFYPTKNLGAFGDGGLITTDDDNLDICCRAIKSHASGKIGADAYAYMFGGQSDVFDNMNVSENGLYDPYKYFNYFIGQNSRLDAIQAGILLKKLLYLDGYNNNRCQIASRYSESFKDLPVVTPRVEFKDKKSCFHQYALLVDDKVQFTEFLAEKGIGTGAFYPVPLHLQKAYRNLGYHEGDLPVAESVCSRSVCLPIFPELTDQEQDYIIECVRSYFGK